MARVRNCPDVPIINSLFGLCLVVVFVVFVFVVVVSVVVVFVVICFVVQTLKKNYRRIQKIVPLSNTWGREITMTKPLRVLN